MAKDRRKLLHMHSSINDKQPTPASLEVGEIAVNNAKDKEFLSIKNSNDKVVRFSSDGQIIDWMERKEVMPYKGYVRGGAGPQSTSGDTPTADGYGSYGIENSDLINNTSELVFKLNQVAASATTKHDKVNGASDKYSKEINPTTDGGINDGAGFFIDMSRYAMQDANPRFSGITNTCYTNLSGTTRIKGLDGDCGSLLEIGVNSALTSANTATTIIKVADTSATTATLSGNTLQIRESGYIDYSGNTLTSYTSDKTCIQANTDLNMGGNTNTRIGYDCSNNSGYSNNVLISASASANTYAPNAAISGTNLDVAETNTTINSCGKIEITTDNFTVNSCTETGSSTFNFCNGYTLNSDKVTIKECNPNGSILIQEKRINLSGGTLSSTTTTDTIVNVGGNTNVVTSGSTTINTKNGTTINTTGSTNITSTNNICETSDATAAFVGSTKTNIGKNCSDGGQTTTLNLNGNTVNITGNTMSAYTSGKSCIVANTDLNLGGNSNTRIGSDCEGNPLSDNVYISATTLTEIKAPTITLSGGTTNITGDTNVNIKGGDVCISGGTDASMGAKSVKIGTDCEGSPIASDVTINSTSAITLTSTTENHTTTNYKLTANTENHNTSSFTVNSTSAACITSNGDATLGGSNSTKIGYDCAGGGITNVTNIYANSSVTINSPTTNISGDTYVGKKLYITSGLSEPLIWQYGSVCNANSGTTNFSANTAAVNRTITIPKTISDVTCGDVTNTNECLNIGKSVCVSGTVTSTQGMYTSSDVNLKNTIGYISGIDLHKANKVNLKSFKYNTDPTGRKVYGVIAQDVEEAGLNELVFVDENGLRSVDYTGLLILKLAALEKEVSMLRHQLRQMTEDNKD